MSVAEPSLDLDLPDHPLERQLFLQRPLERHELARPGRVLGSVHPREAAAGYR